MTYTVAQALARAAGEIGYIEQATRQHPNGNVTKYWADLKPSYQGGAWCAAFTNWVLKPGGLDLIDEVSLPYYVPSIESWAKKNGRWTTKPKAGMLVTFGINPSHIGIVEKVNSDGSIQTIEGNTSPGPSGSQNNGGGVWRRRRSGSWIRGYITIPYAAPSTSRDEPRLTLLTEDGKNGPVTRNAIQKMLGLKADGSWGPSTRKAIQKWAGAEQDGNLGPASSKAVQKKLGIKQTGVWAWDQSDRADATTKALQAFHNRAVRARGKNF